MSFCLLCIIYRLCFSLTITANEKCSVGFGSIGGRLLAVGAMLVVGVGKIIGILVVVTGIKTM